MLPPQFYNMLLALCLIYALLRGGPPERIGIAVMVIGSALSSAWAAGTSNRYVEVEVGILVIDVAVLAAFVILAVRADRLWPIWVSALAGLGVVGHLARWYGGIHVSPQAYAVGIVIWSYAILALIAIGTWNYRQRA